MAARRAATEKAKATRARSWAKNAAAKELRIAEQRERENHNREVGSTGKQRRYSQTVPQRFGTDRLYQRLRAFERAAA
jgi:hypothetical protein